MKVELSLPEHVKVGFVRTESFAALQHVTARNYNEIMRYTVRYVVSDNTEVTKSQRNNRR